MAAEALVRPSHAEATRAAVARLTPENREALARLFAGLAHNRMLRAQAGGRTPPGEHARPQTAAQEPPRGTNTRRSIRVPQ